MQIHPSAVVDPSAELGADVKVGPFAVIEAGAKIGARCEIQAHAVVGGSVTMGEDNMIGYGAIIGGDPQDLAFRRETVSFVRIGDRNRIREYSTIHRGTGEGTATEMGDDCYLMAGAHMGHNSRIANHVILANNALLGGHVSMAERVFVGGGSVFHQFVRVGRLAITQGMSGVGKDIPPFTMAAEINFVAGLNVIGMRRAGMNAEQRQKVKDAFDLLYRSGLNVSQALEKAAETEAEWTPEVREFFEFVKGAKKRGVCALMQQPGKGAREDEADG